eukprot:CAMPEP_0115333084 /NCGR_PEP_ID=MMETSP0270-20121206/87184_1 /TAXON_ID=71861 /ORGANISM="Scrippsiella trochoidea, Strain CCMP3099" /LENGTH=51 /DNA_ID=CAMNT_0002753967 /DNA_START=21 /DNA_END=173 /DNA_ORIENTATION=-
MQQAEQMTATESDGANGSFNGGNGGNAKLTKKATSKTRVLTGGSAELSSPL